MTTYSTCVFCGRNDSPLTREHVIADWIAREFPDPKWTRINPATGERIPFKNSLGLVSRKVCKRCNTGWMHNLEDSAKPILLPLIHAQRTTLTLDDQQLIAKWYFKTACAYDVVAKPTRDCVYTPNERYALATSLSIPPDTYIYIAQYAGTMGHAFTLESHMAPTTQTLLNQYQHLLDTHGYAGTIVIKHVAFQVFTFRRNKYLIGKRLGFAINPVWDMVAVQVWPTTGNVINWPPQARLDNGGLSAFADRWGDMGLVIS